MKRLLAAVALVLLTACQPAPQVDQPKSQVQLPATAPIPVEEAAVKAEPLPKAVAVVSDRVEAPVVQAQDVAAVVAEAVVAAVKQEAKPAEVLVTTTPCRAAASALIVRWEVSSPAFYQRKLERPIWPGGASGITWGIGYDGGTQRRSTILLDWELHEHRDRLAQTSGFVGRDARDLLYRYSDIPTPYHYATRVFEDRSLIEYTRLASRAFRRDVEETLPPNTCAALVSVVYNRGGYMTGDSRRELREIRDVCLPADDYQCIAAQLRSMKRLWRGTVNERGLSARRDAEAQLATTP